MKSSRSFALRLSRRVLLFVSIVFLVSIGLIGLLSYIAMTRQAEDNVMDALNDAIKEVDAVFGKYETAVENMIWVIKDNMDNPDMAQHITSSFLNQNQDILGSALAFEPFFYKTRGEYFSSYSYRDSLSIVSTSFDDEEYDYFTMDWYQIPRLMSKNIWSEPYVENAAHNTMMTTYSVPLWDEFGNVFAVFTADVALDSVRNRLQEIQPYEGSYVFMCSKSGNFVSHPNPEAVLGETIFSITTNNSKAYEISKSLIRGEKAIANLVNDGKRCLVAYGPLSNGWQIGIVCPYSSVYESVNAFLNILLLLTIVLQIILFIVIKKTTMRFTEPITEFAYSAMNIGKGNFNATIPQTDSQDEIRRLHDALKYMLQSINTYIDKLKTTTNAKQRYEGELNVASNIQKLMLPSVFPKSGDCDIYAFLNPAKEVGGDLYDFVIRGRTLYFAIGDVSGKGVPAAMFMAITRSAFRFISGMGLGVAEMVSNINNSFSEGNGSNMFVTLFVGKVNLDTLEMEYCNAGHNPILTIDPQGRSEYLHARPNLAAGLFPDFNYVGEKLQLSKGTRLLVYTDGVTEAEDSVKSLYGEERLKACCESRPADVSSKDFVEGLMSSVRSFTDGNDQNDDITIMSIKFPE